MDFIYISEFTIIKETPNYYYIKPSILPKKYNYIDNTKVIIIKNTQSIKSKILHLQQHQQINNTAIYKLIPFD
jgi:hypothetical protein